ncbi:MAG: hypothetical protein KDH96_07885 [Candidatus Riesia sp.]|nr:hypothetical protein [Candidatus Riesia sp.]
MAFELSSLGKTNIPLASVIRRDDAIGGIKTALIPGFNDLENTIYNLQNVARATSSYSADGKTVIYDPSLTKKIDDLLKIKEEMATELPTKYTGLTSDTGPFAGVSELLKPPERILGELALIQMGQELQRRVMLNEALYPTNMVKVASEAGKAMSNITRAMGKQRTHELIG